MEVMLMIGRYAGEIRDVKPFHALGMIERGEAIDPNAPIAEVAAIPVPAEVPAAVANAAVAVVKRGRR